LKQVQLNRECQFLEDELITTNFSEFNIFWHLKFYKGLRISFAHMGGQQEGNDWQETILENIERNRNVYTDCSCQTPHVEDYQKIKAIMNINTESNILFGTDFVINLIWSDSYNDYLNNFIQNPYLDERQKRLICEINPERFLFG
jgi:predicted TIM-barrel fold metal-dependent hydrolase